MINYEASNLAKLNDIGKAAPEGMKGFQALNTAAFAPGSLDAKTKEIIAVAVAIAKQCPYCLDIHGNNARNAGATDAELAEASLVAAAIGAGAAMTHATHVF